ncbi:hypothetical protein SETIT_2G260100v2 [Setaria italica]|uniref:Uncharacterized protein n=1 Tax=Setaria italica TaxID=4555 RepID=A0A368Q2U0_SETIT|nr:hypothetical protein SETIT_2G260100v2 [Setaria italica]
MARPAAARRALPPDAAGGVRRSGGKERRRSPPETPATRPGRLQRREIVGCSKGSSMACLESEV